MTADDPNALQSKNLDTILVEDIGQFGPFQIYVLILASVPIMFSAISGSEYIFTAGRLPLRCLIPECDDANPEFEPAWLGNAVPGSPGSYDDCNRFVNISIPVTPPPDDICPVEQFDRNQIVNCDKYVYDKTNTVVYDFSLECDEWRRSLIGTIRTVGVLFAMPLAGFMSDRWGRRFALSITAFNGAWVGMLRAFVNSYEWFAALQFVEAVFGSGTFSAGYLLVTEFVGPKYRVIAGPLVSSFAAIGFVILGLLAWGVQYWRHLTLAVFVPQLITIVYFWIMPESVRWLMSKGRYIEAEKTLKRAAAFNNRELSKETVEYLKTNSEAEKSSKTKQNIKEPLLFIQVWKSSVILKRCFVTPIWWISGILVYYGVSLNAVSLAGNPYLNYVYVSAIEIPGYWTAMLVLDRAGRKLTMITGFGICSACQFAFAFIASDLQTVRLVLYLLGKYSISVVITSMYMYTAELYPTKHRHSLFAFSSMIGRIGAIVAPLTPALMMYWVGIPSVIFGSMTLISAALVFTMPETLKTKLPDTIADAERLGLKGDRIEDLEQSQHK